MRCRRLFFARHNNIKYQSFKGFETKGILIVYHIMEKNFFFKRKKPKLSNRSKEQSQGDQNNNNNKHYYYYYYRLVGLLGHELIMVFLLFCVSEKLCMRDKLFGFILNLQIKAKFPKIWLSILQKLNHVWIARSNNLYFWTTNVILAEIFTLSISLTYGLCEAMVGSFKLCYKIKIFR